MTLEQIKPCDELICKKGQNENKGEFLTKSEGMIVMIILM